MTFRAKQPRRGFSLVEVLLAIFILGIGVIALAAIFPAGIAQQRQSVDDVIGPIVANNALSVLRLKLEPDDFGTFEEFGVTAPMYTVDGDWTWLRPGIDPRGSYNVFSDGAPSPDIATEFGDGYTDPDGFVSEPTLNGVPYNMNKWPAHPGKPPFIVITQGERYYPTAPDAALDPSWTGPAPRPQYVWDCMFRRFQGKILVAIFVYRVQLVGGGTVTYSVPPNISNPSIPPLPVNLVMDPNDPAYPSGIFGPAPIWNADENPVLIGTADASAYDPDDARQSWQEPRQWILDQNNGIHRVLSQTSASSVEVELVRPVSLLPPLPPHYFQNAQDTDGDGAPDANVVSNIWYIPVEVDLVVGGNGIPVQLTPVYVTVREL
ncbi:MAG: type IV pilus modification PilV family protein [Planctomycetota bacterium]